MAAWKLTTKPAYLCGQCEGLLLGGEMSGSARGRTLQSQLIWAGFGFEFAAIAKLSQVGNVLR